MNGIGPRERAALALIDRDRMQLTRQQVQTLRGQVLSGDPDGAVKGLNELRRKKNNAKL